MFKIIEKLNEYRMYKSFIKEGYEDIDNIEISPYYKMPNKRKLETKKNFYKNYGMLPEIILNKDGVLIDGFCSYVIAKIYNVKYVKVRRTKVR